MTGIRAGVGALLKQDHSCLITVHCLAHRLELSLKDGAKGIKLYEKAVSTLAMGLYFFYHNSALNRAMLCRSHDATVTSDAECDEKLLMSTRAGGTMSIGHTLVAVSNLCASYRFIVSHLGQVSFKFYYDLKKELSVTVGRSFPLGTPVSSANKLTFMK